MKLNRYQDTDSLYIDLGSIESAHLRIVNQIA